MFISYKNNIVQAKHEVEWRCRMKSKGLTKVEYWDWITSITTQDSNGFDVITYPSEDFTMVECTDEDIEKRISELHEYCGRDPIVYNIRYYADMRDSEVVDVLEHTNPAYTIEAYTNPETGENVAEENVAEENVATTYCQTHLIGQDDAKDARLLAEEWVLIRTERDKLLTSTDWTQSNDTALTSAKVTAWATYRTSLRTLPADQSSETTYADITWPSQP